jgi:hypothetical protein
LDWTNLALEAGKFAFQCSILLELGAPPIASIIAADHSIEKDSDAACLVSPGTPIAKPDSGKGR